MTLATIEDERISGVGLTLVWVILETYTMQAEVHLPTERTAVCRRQGRSVGIARPGRPSTPLRITRPL